MDCENFRTATSGFEILYSIVNTKYKYNILGTAHISNWNL